MKKISSVLVVLIFWGLFGIPNSASGRENTAAKTIGLEAMEKKMGYLFGAFPFSNGKFEDRRKSETLPGKPQPETPPQETSIKAAVISGIGAYLAQLTGACFSKDISIGTLDLFQSAINDSVNRIIVGKEGEDWLKANSSGAKSSHYTWKAIGRTADIIFPFDPRSPGLTMTQRQTMMHEMTHHIEWLKGKKESSRTLLGSANPRSERNTDYQDSVVNALVKWKKIEDDIKDKKNSLMQVLSIWKDLENILRDLEAGSAAGGNRNDADLKSLTGFHVEFGTIKENYLKGKCDDDYRILVMVADLVGRLDWGLEFDGPKEATLGDTVSLKAVPWNGMNTAAPKVELKPELGATFHWKIPDANARIGNPIDFTPTEAIAYKIPVELIIPFGSKDYVIAKGDYDLSVKSKPTPPGVGHHIEYLGDDPKMGKTEEYDFILLPPDVFYEKASKIFDRQPTKEERDDAEYRNARMVMNLDPAQLRIGLMMLTGGDKKKVEDLMAQIGEGLLWIIFHGKYIDYIGDRKNYQREFKEGILEGEHIGWHENGKIKEKGKFLGNVQIGEWQTFDTSERLVKTEFYEKGKVVWIDSWGYYPNGRISNEGPRRITAPGASSPNLSDGPFVEYYENGNMKQRGQYNKDRRSGLWETWDEKGTLRQKAVYSDPPDSDRNSFETNYDQQGQITEEGGYDRMGQKHGTWVEVSGERKITREYNHGRVVRR